MGADIGSCDCLLRVIRGSGASGADNNLAFEGHDAF
jgi:hypothetical protein